MLTSQQIDALAKLARKHAYDETIFGGFYCTKCTPEGSDDNVMWPCPALAEAGMDQALAAMFVSGFRDGIAVQAAQTAAALAKVKAAEVEHRKLDDLLAAAIRERDLARAGDAQEYPTADAYDKACAAVHKHRGRADLLRQTLGLILRGIQEREPLVDAAAEYVDKVGELIAKAIAEDLALRNTKPDVDLAGLSADIGMLRELLNRSLRSNVMCKHRLASGVDALTEHLAECSPATQVIVIDTGSGDAELQRLAEAGWTWDRNAEYVCGKRIRVLNAPEPTALVDDVPVFPHLPTEPETVSAGDGLSGTGALDRATETSPVMSTSDTDGEVAL